MARTVRSTHDGREEEDVHILLIEDHPGAVRLLRHALSESAVSVQLSVVEDGDQALAFLRREGDYSAAPRPDLILLDLNLPKTDGRIVLQVLRATPAWKTIPIMILTGVPQDVDHQQAAILGVERFLRKPRDLQEYRALVEDITAWWQIRARTSPP